MKARNFSKYAFLSSAYNFCKRRFNVAFNEEKLGFGRMLQIRITLMRILDPCFHFNADQTYNLTADPGRNPYQSDANLQPLIHRPSRALWNTIISGYWRAPAKRWMYFVFCRFSFEIDQSTTSLFSNRFASRQDQSRPETWLASKCPCPTCRKDASPITPQTLLENVWHLFW